MLTLYVVLGYVAVAIVVFLLLRFLCDEFREEDNIDFLVTSAVWPAVLLILCLIFGVEIYDRLKFKFGGKNKTY